MQPKVYEYINEPRIIACNPEVFEYKNSITSIINRDAELQKLYKDGAIKLGLNNNVIDLYSSTIHSGYMEIELFENDDIEIFISDEYFTIESNNPSKDLYIMFLNQDMVVYGDEQRTKMKHIAEYNIPFDQLTKVNGGYTYNITPLFKETSKDFMDGTHNMISITTDNARAYHYYKQKNNAFYHLEAINLPFHEFYFSYSKD